ncbi:polysaccharide pyruvyl transferase family protein [Bacteroides sp.]|uniref:polysaccharide pyruvyl transferase family protein n=1 Tax=Bacteroides sp. TaxID=29523 RepID=UPI003A9494E9
MINKYINYISKTLNTIYYHIKYGGTGIVINSWIYLRFDKIRHRNFGDELNYYLLCELTEQPISNLIDICKWGRRGKTDLLFIGSLVEDFTTPDTIIWGSGAICGGNKILRNKPKEVRAVRGKLTRNYLLNNGVYCPEIYGDPALLCPLIYQSPVEKKYKIGLIPHVDDFHNPIVKVLEERGVYIIKLADYKKWHDVIDEICQCEIIVSSSLHGLILADAYEIPNVWATISGKLLGGTFKFQDYFSGVNRCVDLPLILTETTSIPEIEQLAQNYSTIDFDISKFIKSAPIKISLSKCLN